MSKYTLVLADESGSRFGNYESDTPFGAISVGDNFWTTTDTPQLFRVIEIRHTITGKGITGPELVCHEILLLLELAEND